MLFAVAAGASLVLAKTCQPGNSTPRFLAAQRSAVSSRREEIAILRWRVNTQGSADPCANPGVLVGNCYPVERFYGFCQHSRSGLQLHTGLQLIQRSGCRAANLQSFAAARHFCSAKILAGGLRWGWGPRRSREIHRPRKEISRGNLLCAKSGLTNLSYPRLESAQKYVTTPDWENLCTGQPRGARGTAVPLFREESRGTPSKGFLWATSSRRLDTALLFADKKRGVETYQAGRALPVETGACRHGRQQKLTVPPSQRQTPPAGGNSPTKPPARSCLPSHTAPCRASSPDILPGRDENHS